MPSRLLLPFNPRATRAGQAALNLVYTNKVDALDPIAYWTLGDDVGATTASDASGNGRDGTVTAVTFGAGGVGDGRTSGSLNGTTSFINIQGASLANAFNGAEGTLSLWSKVSAAGVWTDGISRYMAIVFVDASNLVYVRKNAGNNSMQFVYVAGGTTDAVIATYSGAGWTHFAMTWSKDAEQLKAYTNGVQTGATQTALGIFAGTPTVSLIGAQTAAPTTVWSGTEAHVALFSRALTPAQVASLATIS